MFYTTESLYFLNSTYRNPERVVNAAIAISHYKKEKESQNLSTDLSDLRNIINSDVKFREPTAQMFHKSFLRKKVEIAKLGFGKINCKGQVETELDIDSLNPTSLVEGEGEGAEAEWKSNVILYALSKNKHLEFISELINAVDEAWGNTDSRKGVSEMELVFLYGYLDANLTSRVNTMVKLIVDMRNECKANGVTNEKKFLKDRIISKYGVKTFNNSRDYIDSLIRSLVLSGCFEVKGYGYTEKNASNFAMRLVQINDNLRSKIDFFRKNTFTQLTEFINQKTFCEKLYGQAA